jgi:hypothetical protein
MATSYRKLPHLNPSNILVFDKPTLPPKEPPVEVQKLPKLDKPSALHDVQALLEQMRKLPQLKAEKWQVGETYTLSARKPWIDNRGYIEAFQPLMAIAEQPTYQFVNNVGISDDARNIQVWLTDLTPGASYIVQLRVQAGTGGQFKISTGEGGRQTAPAGDQTIAVLLFQVERQMSLVRVENHGAHYWAFVDATITAIQT